MLWSVVLVFVSWLVLWVDVNLPVIARVSGYAPASQCVPL